MLIWLLTANVLVVLVTGEEMKVLQSAPANSKFFCKDDLQLVWSDRVNPEETGTSAIENTVIKETFNQTEVKNFTMCASYKIETLDSYGTRRRFIEFDAENGPLAVEIEVLEEDAEDKAIIQFQKFTFFDQLMLGHVSADLGGWFFFCIDVDLSTENIEITVDGVKLENNEAPKESFTDGENYLNNIRIEASNPVTNINLFTNTDSKNISCYATGNLLSHDDMEGSWHIAYDGPDFEGLDVYVSLDALCGGLRQYLYVLTTKTTFYDAQDVCNNLGNGFFYDVTKFNGLDDIIDEEYLNTLWLPYIDKNGRGSMEHMTSYHGAELKEEENDRCLMNTAKSNASVPCKSYNYAVCVFRKMPVLYLRGLCDYSYLDKVYYPTLEDACVENNIKYISSWRGRYGSVMYYHETTKTMRIYSSSTAAIATTIPRTKFLFGKSVATVYADQGCSQDNQYSALISYSPCSRDQFNCDDGHCVHLDEKCNGVYDCWDGSDELYCNVISMSNREYNSESLPGGFLTFSVSLTDILQLDDFNKNFRVKYKMSFSWKDNRLMFKNLKKGWLTVIMSEEEKKYIWKPRIKSINIKDENDFVYHTQDIISVESLAENVGSPSFSEAHHSYAVSGRNATLHLSYLASVNYICPFELTLFPFDVNYCSMKLVLNKEQANQIRIEPEKLEILSRRDVSQFFLVDSIMCLVSGEKNGVLLTLYVVFDRHLGRFILMTCLPTVLAIIIGQTTNHIQERFFHTSCGLNLTILLVLTTMYVNTLTSLPQTTYVKMIDIWLLFCMAMPFFDVIFQIYGNILRAELEESKDKPKEDKVFRARSGKILRFSDKTSDEKRMTKLQLQMMWIIQFRIKPVTILLFVTVFWIVGLTLRTQRLSELEGYATDDQCIRANFTSMDDKRLLWMSSI